MQNEQVDNCSDKNNAISNNLNLQKTKKFREIPNINQLVDKLLSEKTDKIKNTQKTEIDINSFSLKNKDGNNIYYLKRKNGKKENGDQENEIPDKKEENNQNIIDEEHAPIVKKRIRFGRKKEDEEIFNKPKTKQELAQSKEFDEIINEIEKISEEKGKNKKVKTDKGQESQDKKLKEIDNIILSKKAIKEDEKDWLSSSTDNLAELKKKYSNNIEIKTPEPEKQKEKIEEDKSAFKSKKSFFNKEKSSEIKEEPSMKKIDEKEELKITKLPYVEKKEEKPIEKLVEAPPIKPVFRVENLPKKEEFEDDDLLLIDKKLKESKPLIEDNEDTNIEAEKKAILFAKKHFEKDENKPKQNIKNKKDDIDIPTGVPLTDHSSEHVFFDEEQLGFGGWSPKILDAEKKKPKVSPTGTGEIDIDTSKELGEIELPKEVLQSKSVSLKDLGFSENEWEELDFYSLHEPFAYVEILRERDSLDKCYFLVEIALTEEEEKLIGFIEETMGRVAIDTLDLEKRGFDNYLLDKIDEVIKEYNINLSEDSKKKVFYYLGKGSLGLGKIDPIMKDPNIEDISCDGSSVPLFLYHRKYGSLKSNVKFVNEEELSSFVHKLAQKCGKHISIAEPMLDATMPDGSRIQMTLSDEISAKGSTFTIRKFRADPFSPPDLIDFNTMSSEMVAYMWLAVENRINTLFAGGTASGKTTTLNALSLFIPRESKIVSIEETRELNLPHPNWIPGVSRAGFGEIVADRVVGEIDLYDLMKAALRQRPEYILVGEIRGKEAYVLFQAMATGHATYSTVHADSAQSLIHRLEGKPINIPRVMLQSLDIVCLHITTRVKNNRARRCKQIIEIIDIDPTTKEILTNEVFRWDPVEDNFVYSGKSYVLERIRAEKDLSREEMTSELKNRMKIVEWMNKNNVREFRDVANLITRYAEAPLETLKYIEKDVKVEKE